MKKIMIMLAIFACTEAAFAQSSFTMSYPISFPMGDLKDYVGKTSFRGFILEFYKRQKQNIDIGLESGWLVFYQREDSKVYTEGTASISGIQYRYTNSVPILASAKFYKLSNDKITEPYIGIGLGTLYVNRATDFGLYRITNEAWQFCIRPELGVQVKMQNGVSGLLGVKYYAAFGNSDLYGQSFLSINFGLVFSAF
jgi:hypothetical protein